MQLRSASRRVLGSVAALVLLCAGLVCLGVGASAPASAGPYPPAVCASLGISTSMPYPGQAIQITGTGFTPGKRVSLVVHSPSTTLGHATVAADGTFATTVRIPKDMTGRHLLIAAGGQPSCPVDPIVLTIQGPSSPHSSTPNGPGSATTPPATHAPNGANNNGGLPFTGTDALGLLAIALGLLALGLLLNQRGRRRPGGRRYAGGSHRA